MMSAKFSNISPGRILLASFLFVIGTGTFLLSLPMSRVVEISFLDLLFTSVSVTCVTGLKVVPMYYFSLFGKCVILALIQIGGLGLMTLSFFMISLFLKLKLTAQLIAGQLLEFKFWSKIKTFLTLIVGTTIIVELIGAILLYPTFKESFPFKQAIFYSIFHSVSAFCNAGLSPLENNMISYIHHPFSLLTLSILVFFGGIGFIVWYEIVNLTQKIIRSLKNKEGRIFNISLHTKIVLTASSILIIWGTFLFWLLERNNTLRGLSFINKIINALFMSITIRCAGFQTMNIDELALPTLLVILVLMFIGASPSSAGGGVKTTTFTLFLATVIAIVRNRTSIEIGGRTIPTDQIYKTTAIISLVLIWLITTTFFLLITEKSFSFIQIFFEATSAFTTVGLSTGITPYLSSTGKILIMISMLVGRIGTLTLVLALRRKKEPQLYRYPEERIVIG